MLAEGRWGSSEAGVGGVHMRLGREELRRGWDGRGSGEARMGGAQERLG